MTNDENELIYGSGVCYDERVKLARSVKTSDLLLYHGKIHGDLEGGSFRQQPTFFAMHPDECHAYAEQTADGEFDLDEDGGAITIFPVRLTLENPCITDWNTLQGFARDLGIPDRDVDKFCERFEDSEIPERATIFDHVRSLGYDGIIMPNDLMPICANGDWQMQISIVAFDPERQVKFCIAEGFDSTPPTKRRKINQHP